jgi:hypothetical protein
MVNISFSIQRIIFFEFLDMKNQYIKLNSNRYESTNKIQLATRLKVIEFLKDQLYPTGFYLTK